MGQPRAAAPGSILYVVPRLVGVASRFPTRSWLYVGVLAGPLVGFLTDMVVTLGAHEETGQPGPRRR